MGIIGERQRKITSHQTRERKCKYALRGEQRGRKCGGVGAHSWAGAKARPRAKSGGKYGGAIRKSLNNVWERRVGQAKKYHAQRRDEAETW